MNRSVIRENAPGVMSMMFWVMAIGAVFIVCAFNLQPWFVIGQDVADQIFLVPFLGWLGRALLGVSGAKVIGIVCGIVGYSLIRSKRWVIGISLIAIALALLGTGTTLVENLGSVAGFILWGWVTWVQVMPMIARVLGGDYAAWKAKLRRYRNWAYLIEFTVCFFRFPVYADGDLGLLFSDLANFTLNPADLSVLNSLRLMGSVLAVELTIKFLIEMFLPLGLGAASSHQPQSTAAQVHVEVPADQPNAQSRRGYRRTYRRGARHAS